MLTARLNLAVAQLAALGVRAFAFEEDDDGNPGVIVVTGGHVKDNLCFTTTRETIDTLAATLEWAVIVATQVHGVVA